MSDGSGIGGNCGTEVSEGGTGGAERVSYSFLKRVLLVLLCEKKCPIYPLHRIIELLDEMIVEKPTVAEAAERVAKVIGEI